MITPELNTAVLFQVASEAVHAVEPVRSNEPRRSLALFYYTAHPLEARIAQPPADWHFELADHQTTRWTRRRLARILLAASLCFHRAYYWTNRNAKRMAGAPRLTAGSDRNQRRS